LKKKLNFLILIFAVSGPVYLMAAEKKPPAKPSPAPSVSVNKSSASAEVKLSTNPVGSPFIRHLASDFQVDVIKLSKFEKRGFSRSEIITLLLISEKTKKPMKELGTERLKSQIPLRDMAKREAMDYDELYQMVKDIKEDVESRGEHGLPPPVFEPVASPAPK
jgi:hypothetical protein